MSLPASLLGTRRRRSPQLSAEAGAGGGASAARVAGIGSVVVNASYFAFQLMVARISTPAVFGAFMALLGLLLIFEAPASMFQVTVARAVDRHRASEDGHLGIDTGTLMADTLVGSVLSCLALLALSVPLSHFLHLGPGGTALLIATYAIPVGIGVVPKGVLAAFGCTRILWAGLIAGAVVRLGLGTALVHGSPGLRGAMVAVVAGEAVTAAVLLIAMRARFGLRSLRAMGLPTVAIRWRDVGGDGMAFTGFWFLTGVDMVLARHYLPVGEAGLYGAAATLAQLTMIVTGAVASATFARLVGAGSALGRRRQALFLGVITAVSLSLAVSVVLRVFAHDLLRDLFDANYVASTPIIGLLATAGVALGLVSVLMHYFLARGARLPASASWIGVIALVAITTVHHGSMGAIADNTLVSVVATGLTMLGIAVHSVWYGRRTVDRASLAEPEGSLDLTVVVPYYNPGLLLRANLVRIVEVLDDLGVTFELVAVSDGSTDGSELSIADLDDHRIHRVILPKNQGKGAALRAGLALGRGRYLGFIDADGDLDPKLLEPFVALTREHHPDIVMGSKRHPLSEVSYPPLRRVYSVGYEMLVRVLFNLHVRDTQTGLKLMRRDMLAAVLPRMVEKRFAFDLELLVAARRLGYDKVIEAPVLVRDQLTSTVSWRSVKQILVDTVAILYRSRILRHYDLAPSEARTYPRIRLVS